MWLRNIEGSCREISTSIPTVSFTTDASLLGWGAVTNGEVTNGKWSDCERTLHINALETLEVFKALTTIFPNNYNTHFKLLSDNTTTIAYVNKAGGTWSK